jgi:L-gulonate 3-dehydrogenase
MRVPKVAIIGAGLIGRSWAVVFSRAGWDVRVTDPNSGILEQTQELIRASLEELSAYGLVADPSGAAKCITVTRSLAAALDGADLVQENGPEDADVKRRIFTELDDLAPETSILASSTSAIVASRFTEALPGRRRCLVAHPVNPPHLVPLVELCGAPWTSAETIARARSLYESVGQAPIVVNGEIEGFVLNRLQGALLSEALRLAGEGVASPQDIDRTVKEGLGLRWSFLGPFETIELNAPGGIADYCRRYGAFYRRLSEDPAGPEVWNPETIARVLESWSQTPEPAELTRRSSWRDRRLAALIGHKRSQPDSA